MVIEFKPSPSLLPPSTAVKPIAWVRQNLFSFPFNMFLTLLSIYIINLIIPPIIKY